MLVGGSWVAKTGGGIKDVSHDCNDKKKKYGSRGSRNGLGHNCRKVYHSDHFIPHIGV